MADAATASATDDGSEPGGDSGPESESVDRSLLGAVVAFSLLATALRLVHLGVRTAHWDEARHGYAVLRYGATGVWEYRPILHGPLLAHANELLFGVFGASDAVARLFPALLGGLLPLSAWLFRERLRRSEVVALAALLAVNPALLYYSRFARSDLLVATFAFVTVGLVVRLLDTREPGYLYAASVSFALAVASKENALVYLACWLGAGALLVDHRLFWKRWSLVGDGERRLAAPDWLRGRVDEAVVLFAVLNPLVVALVPGVGRVVAIVLLLVVLRCALWVVPRDGEAFPAIVGVGVAVLSLLVFVGDAVVATYAVAWLVAAAYVLGVLLRGTDAGRTLGLWRGPVLLSGVVFTVVVTALYLPRGTGVGALAGDPLLLADLVESALFGSWTAASDLWFGSVQDQSVLPYTIFFVKTLLAGAAVTCVFGVVGLLLDRYRDGGARDLVAFCGYWGLASVVVYPVVMYGMGPWHAVHVAVPLAVPAAVALSLVYRWGRDAVADRRAVSAALAVLVLTGGAGTAVGAAVATSYHSSASPDNGLVQPGQPGTDLDPALAHVSAATAAHDDGPDVLYYGAYFAMDDESAADSLPVTDEYGWRDDTYRQLARNEAWYNRLPLPWYFEQQGLETASARNATALRAALESPPPVVVTRAAHRDTVARELGGGYEQYPVQLTVNGTNTVVFVNASAGRESKR
ncbi:flippase activity-associated protein Agl23 [Haloarchaeobius litoreus]|uniref:Flippase activity-associated protein Agl23 n=1 Tax=Haloarchaeobius litoreus TaxID=755306 RepID=A0ABD6DJR9_9EURY|nr:flippase activity-associated protein Agl23 [Haloarchaeobius litoreus]